MGLENIEKDTNLHTTNDTVSTIELVLKGTVSVNIGGRKIPFGQGSMLGLQEQCDENYHYTYKAESPVQIFSYPYADNSSISKIIEANAKISPALAAKAVKNALVMIKTYKDLYKDIAKEYQTLKKNLDDYPVSCKRVNAEQKSFSNLYDVVAPTEAVLLDKWQADYLEALKENEKKLMVGYYALSPAIAAGVILLMKTIEEKTQKHIFELLTYRNNLMKEAEDFNSELKMLEMKLNAAKQNMQIGGDDDGGEVPLIQNAMDIILSYSDIDKDKAIGLKELIGEYKAIPDRRVTTDPVRRLRKKLTDEFYDLYLKCYLKSREDPMSIPVEVRMFLFFGFFDEELANPQNTEIMYRIISSYRPDPKGHVFTLYQWLMMVQDGIVVPSRNEFEQDFEGFMREQRDRGDISDEEYARDIKNPIAKLKYEMNNIFKMGNRMTYGKVSTFQPFFDADNVVNDLNNAYMSPEKVNEAVDRISGIDKSLFRRERDYRNEELGIKGMALHVEVIPNFILFPNVGTRAALWQEIEGKKRDSSARMIMPIFLVEDLTKSFTTLCGEYRWEIIKTEQGVHWNDLKDLSLTSEYNDYIQFYRKNRELNAEQKEKLKKQIQKAGSNLRRTFVSDYNVFINSESNGSPLMNKVARRILFTYCPFSASYREKLKSIPLYEGELNKFETKKEERVRPIINIIKKMENQGIEVPRELTDEVSYQNS